MTRLVPVWLVAGREIRLRVLSRPFVVATGLFSVLVAAGAAVSVAAGDRSPRYSVGLVDAPAGAAATVRRVAEVAGVDVETRRYPDARAGDRALREERADLVIDGRIATTHRPVDGDSGLGRLARGVATGVATEGPIPAAPTAAAPVRALEPPAAGDGRRGIAVGATAALLMGILTFGGLVTGAIVEEKVTRVVELLVSTIRPSHLLAGKVIGIGVTGLLQLSIVGGTAALAAAGVGGSLPEGALPTVVATIAWFALGFALFGSLYATAGALVSRLEDAQSASFPVTVLILVVYFIASFSDPGSSALRVLSFVPFAAPFATVPRIAAGVASWWEVALSAALTLATVVVVLRAAGRVFRGGVLRRGPRMRLREAWAAGVG